MSIGQNYSQPVHTARNYYNSTDADNFYHLVWGGEDIHIGLYNSQSDDISTASLRTVQKMASKTSKLSNVAKVLDIGSGYGGAARFLSREYGCHVTALNLSEVENTRHRENNVKEGLNDKIDVIDGNFENIPCDDSTFDLVWSQDAILHSGRRERVIEEVSRALNVGGDFLFTDPMQSDNCPADVLRPILDRIHLDSLGSPSFYRETCLRHDLHFLEFEDLTEQLVNHYSAVLRETQRIEGSLREHISSDYLTRMKKGLQHWIDGGKSGYLCWGIFHFRKM